MPRITDRLNFLSSWPGWVRGVATVLSAIIIALLGVGLFSRLFFTPIANPVYGASFSKLRADELGTDWRANYLGLLDDLHLPHLRLMSYWSEFEPTRGQFDFRDLDWQLDQAARHGTKVSLVIGMRQPRWPECYQPAWARQLSGNAWKQALYAYIEIVVKRYQHHPALERWQLENEPLNTWFGPCGSNDSQRLREEFALLKRLDQTHPVVISLSDEHGLAINQPVPDIYGFSVYRTIYNGIGPGLYFTYPTPVWYHRLRAAVLDMIHHRPSVIHELQLEPWGPRDTKELSLQEQDRSMSVAQIHQNIRFARKLGMRNIDLWGAEWWYWRKIHFNDPSIWEAVKAEINTSH